MNTKLLGGIIVTIVTIVAITVAHQQLPTTPSVLPPNMEVTPTTPSTPKLPADSTPRDPRALKDKTWVWYQTVSDGVSITPQKPGVFTLVFGTDGRVTGTTDCNGFGGEYIVGSDGILTFEPFFTTLMYCEGSQEGSYNTILAQTTSYEIDSTGMLILSGTAGAVYFK
jgi:heat shock protein HslJ